MKVMVFGTFDILHPGHEDFFSQAKEYGDYLVVVLARDTTVKQVKGHLPSNTERERARQLERLDIVDEVVLGHEDDKYKVIEDIVPDVICLGYDQDSFTNNLTRELEKRNLQVSIHRLKPYKPETFKSSKLRK